MRGAPGTARSYLYVPGDRPERFAKAAASGADAVIIDLEDAVLAPAKDEARGNAAEALGSAPTGGPEWWVRVNHGERGLDDLAALVGRTSLTGVVMPKASTAAIRDARTVLDETPAIALVESAAAVLELPALAASGVVALALGEVDLAADLGIEASPDGAELWPLRLQAVVASTAAGIAPPIGPVWVGIRDSDGLRASTTDLRRRGFGARQVIHPDQVIPVNVAFTPTAAEIAAARAALDAADAGSGVWVDADGRMVDEAVLRSARRVITHAD
jgi:citrate lyase subunit beta / citryl-CoA lyase